MVVLNSYVDEQFHLINLCGKDGRVKVFLRRAEVTKYLINLIILHEEKVRKRTSYLLAPLLIASNQTRR